MLLSKASAPRAMRLPQVHDTRKYGLQEGYASSPRQYSRGRSVDSPRHNEAQTAPANQPALIAG
jgi:hypothetical protein